MNYYTQLFGTGNLTLKATILFEVFWNEAFVFLCFFFTGFFLFFKSVKHTQTYIEQNNNPLCAHYPF